MPTLSIDQLKPFMVLAAEVRNRSGRLLAPRGMVLSEKHFVVFKTWGIKDVEIVAQDEPVTAEMHQETSAISETTDQETFNKTREKIEMIFLPEELEHPFIQRLVELAVRKQVSRHEH
ncbi:MAG: hypothetical protein JXQ81_03600 [Desulfuromonadales bacterium]|nr:hypothetical protein [Desulfuromonadales bacterium]MBN2791574.1 hypothetical protein [Desulfuromonadales bacterium]